MTEVVRPGGVVPLTNQIQHYAWGRVGVLSELVGAEADGRPEAELWMGAHPKAPSVLPDGTRLDQAIAADPRWWLGPDIDTLPFLFKVLAADQPLSIQAHPSLAQARAGYESENRAGIALDAPDRSYRDPNHKPELICALTPFVAKCGFRPPAEAARLLDGLAVPALRELADVLRRDAETPGVRLQRVVSELLAMGEDQAGDLSEAAAVGAQAKLGAGGRFVAEFGAELASCADIRAAFPGDIGLVVALLLNHVVLEPGEALFLAAGNLHCYLSGVGIEIMANSDNVLRGGLTPKHIDVDELLRVVDWDAQPIPRQRATGADHRFDVPVEDFALRRIEVSGSPATVRGPAIVLLTDGTGASLSGTPIHVGHPVFVPAGIGPVELIGDGLAWAAGVSASVAPTG